MKTKLITYEHSENGILLFVVPETDEERQLLAGLWRHGKLELLNGMADRSGQGYAVAWKLEQKQKQLTEHPQKQQLPAGD